MSEKARTAVILAAFVAGTAVLWWLVGGGGETKNAPAPGPQPVPALSTANNELPPGTIANSTPREIRPRRTELARQRREHGALRGNITAPSAESYVDAKVILHRIDWEPHEAPKEDSLRPAAIVDPDGDYGFAGLPLGKYIVEALAPGLRGVGEMELTLEEPEAVRDLILEAVGLISGTVVDAHDAAVEGAYVFASGLRKAGNEYFPSAAVAGAGRVLTGKDGGFELDSVAPQYEYKLTVKAEGFATSTSHYVPVGIRDVVLRITKGGGASGRLVEAGTGAPVPFVSIRTATRYTIERAQVTSDEDGLFRFSSLAPGGHEIVLDHSTLVALETTAHFRVAEGTETKGLRVEVVPGGTVSGRVYNVDTDNGIAGVSVYVVPQGVVGADYERSKTAATGEFTVSGLREGTYRVSRGMIVMYPRPVNEGRQVSVSVNQEFAGIDFPISQGLLISGIVVDVEGNAVESVRVSTHPSRGSIRSQSARTKKDGTFTLAGYLPHTVHVLRAEKKGIAGPRITGIDIGENGIHDLRITMEPGSSVEGYVVDPAGRPVPGARFYAAQTRSFDGGLYVRTALSDGTFLVENLVAGTYYFTFYRAGGSIDIEPAKEIAVAMGEHVTGVRLVYEENTGAVIAGRVTNREGRPLVQALVRVSGPQSGYGRTDKDGRYRIANLPDGLFKVDATHNAHTAMTLNDVPQDSFSVDFVLPGRGAIEGRVVDKLTGGPVRNFRVNYLKEAPQRLRPGMLEEFQAGSDAEGRFTVANVEEGVATVHIRAVGFSPATETVDGVLAGETIRDVVIRLDPGSAVQGMVINDLGEPVRGAEIFVDEYPKYNRAQSVLARTGSEGTFRLDSLSPRETEIFAAHGNYVPGSALVYLQPGPNNEVEIVLAQGGAIEGNVTMGGVPMRNIQVSFSLPFPNRRLDARTNEAGYYVIRGIRPGPGTVRAYINVDGMQRNRTAAAEVEPGSVTAVDFEFPDPSASIEGTVRAEDGTPIAGAYVSVTIQTGQSGNDTETFRGQTDEDGFYRLADLPSGMAEFGVTTSGGKPYRKEFELAPGEPREVNVTLQTGARIHVRVTGAPEGFRLTVVAIPGEYQLAERTLEAMEALQSLVVRMLSDVDADVDGRFTLAGLDPDTYTVIALALPDVDIEDAGLSPVAVRAQYEEVFRQTLAARDVVTLSGNEAEVSLDLSF